MAKSKVTYICNACGAVHNGWSGRCDACGAWNTIEQQIDVTSPTKAAQALKSGRVIDTIELGSKVAKPKNRLLVGIKEINDVLGGGIVEGSVILIAGQPGIGKSTIMMQLANEIARQEKVLYISGEESPQQVAMRGQRLKTSSQNLKLASSTSANDIAATISTGQHKLVVVDSIQTIAAEEIAGVPGSVSQVTNSTQLISLAAKQSDTAVILVGHVTKEGNIAGPKVLRTRCGCGT